jgi:hypothetical protein
MKKMTPMLKDFDKKGKDSKKENNEIDLLSVNKNQFRLRYGSPQPKLHSKKFRFNS